MRGRSRASKFVLGLSGLLGLSALVALGSTGCVLNRGGFGDGRFDAGPGLDAQPGLDAPGEDAGEPSDVGPTPIDSRPTPTDSRPTPIDSGPVDSGPGCEERCEGTGALVRCVGGVETRVDCMAGQRCEEGSTGPACVSLACTPGAARCAMDGTVRMVCNAEGTGESTEPCTRGCVAGACRAPTACGIGGVAEVTPGTTTRFDLCGAGNDHDHAFDAGACVAGDADGEDLVVRLSVARPGTYVIDLMDPRGGARVDPLVYLRLACEEQSSEQNCDDESGDEHDARMYIRLEPGDYFIVLDSRMRSMGMMTFGCGPVDLRVTGP